MNDLLSIKQVIAEYGVTREDINNWIRQGLEYYIKDNRSNDREVCMKLEDIEYFLNYKPRRLQNVQ